MDQLDCTLNLVRFAVIGIRVHHFSIASFEYSRCADCATSGDIIGSDPAWAPYPNGWF